MKAFQGGLCSRCGKVPYQSKGDALTKLAANTSRGMKRGSVYWDALCASWHLSSHTADPKRYRDPQKPRRGHGCA